MVTGWKKAKIGELTDIVNGGTPSTAIAEYWNGGINWCTPSDITKKKTKYLSNTEKTITEKGLNESSASLLPIGTILLCSRATIGEMSIAASEIATNQGFKNLICKKEVDNEFLYYALFLLRNKMLELAIGTTFLEISKSALQSIEVIIPADIIEQTAIAEALSDVDSLIFSLQKLIEKKKAIKQGAMQELLTGKKRLSGFSGEWNQFRLGEMTEIYSGGTPSTTISEYWGGSIPWMSSGELNNKKIYDVEGRITQKGMQNSSAHLIPKYCVLIGLAGQGKTRGTAAYNYISLCTNQSIAAIYPNDKKFDSRFLYYIIDSMYESLRELSSGDGGRGGLTKGLISNLEIYMPEVPEQQAVAQVLSDMDSEIETC